MLGIAGAPSDRDVLYVFGSGPRLWRVDGAATVRRVGTRLPREIFGVGGDSSDYCLAIAVDPGNPARILIGGMGVVSPDQGMSSAAMYRITLQGALPAANAFWATDYRGGNILDATWVGEGVHADVHRIRWVAGPAVPPVFVATDGGAFLSTRSADRGTFGSRATGMAVSEVGYVASHPDTDGAVLIGCQDNGAQLRLGGTWRHLPFTADAGGVAFDPGIRGRLIAQVYNSTWYDQAGAHVSPTWRFDATDNAYITEDAAARFYSNAAARLRADGVTQLVIGTDRIWYTEKWGASRWDGVVGVWRREWMTIPSRTDPRSGNAQNLTTDQLASGPFPPGTVDWSPGIRALRWGGDHRLYALLPGAVYRLDRNPATMAWNAGDADQPPPRLAGGGAPPARRCRPEPATGRHAERHGGPRRHRGTARLVLHRDEPPDRAGVVVRRHRHVASVRARRAAATGRSTSGHATECAPPLTRSSSTRTIPRSSTRAPPSASGAGS